MSNRSVQLPAVSLPAPSTARYWYDTGPFSPAAGAVKPPPVTSVHADSPARRACTAARPEPPASPEVRVTSTSALCQAVSASALLEIAGAERSMLMNAACASSTLPARSTAR